MSTLILQETLKSNPSNIIDLYEADLSIYGVVEPIRFFSGLTKIGTQLVWNANTYTAFPLEASGFEWDGSGKLPSPKIIVANINGFMSALNFEYKDLIGIKITRRRTFLKFLDAINFEGGVNATADPTAEFPKELYFVDRKVNENNISVEYELASALDLSNSKLPKRVIAQNICMWKYKSSECGYLGTTYFDEFGNPTTLANDSCGKRLSDCKKRFYSISNTYRVINFGGFPGSGLMR
jgi:lambda family phage minor tail protein L